MAKYNRTHKNNTHVVVYDLKGNYINTFTSLRQMAEVLMVDRHVVARILKGERKNNYPYVFEYEQSQSTIESIAIEKDNSEEASRVHTRCNSLYGSARVLKYGNSV